MIIGIFGSWIIGVVILYLAQKPTSKGIRIFLRIAGFFFLALPFLYGFWNKYVDPYIYK